MPLVRLDDMLQHARSMGYAVGAYGAVDSTFVSAIVAGAERARAPVIVSFAEPHFKHCDFPALMASAEAAARRAAVPIALFLDRGKGLDGAIAAIRHGCNGVMVDASHLSFDENVAATRSVIDMAHAVGAPVEGGLGHVPDLDDVATTYSSGGIHPTSPEEAARYVSATGVDFLAVSVGTVQDEWSGEPCLDLDCLGAIAKAAAVPLAIRDGTALSDEQFSVVIARGVAKIDYFTALSDLAAAAASNALADVESGYVAATAAVHAAIADEVERTCRAFGAAGRGEAVLAACRAWRDVEHVIHFGWAQTAAGREEEFERVGREVLATVPGVRDVRLGTEIGGEARYPKCWMIRLASREAEAAYMSDHAHLDYAKNIFRPHAGDRFKSDLEME